MTGGVARLSVDRLHLGRFRSYRSATVETGGAPVALHGPNGAGKTNLLEAVSLLVPGRGLRRAAPEAMAQRPDPEGWRVRAEVTGVSGPVEIVTGASADARRMVEVDAKAVAQTRLGSHLRMVWLTPGMDGLWTGPAADRRRFLDRLTLGFEPAHAQIAIDYDKAMRARNRLLREGSADRAWLSALEEQMGRFGAAMARARAQALARLVAAQGRAQTAFPSADLEIEGAMEARFSASDDPRAIEPVEAEGLTRALAAGRVADTAAGRALNGPHRSDLRAIYAAKGMPAAVCSTGEQKALLLSLILSNARALTSATGAAPVLLLDEVAAHLDADRRAALYSELTVLGAQVWATGTGVEQVAGLQGALRLAVHERDGVSRVAPV